MTVANRRPKELVWLTLAYLAVQLAIVLASPIGLWPRWFWSDALGALVDAEISLIVIWVVFGRARWWTRIIVPLAAISVYIAAWYYAEHILIFSGDANHHRLLATDLTLVAMFMRVCGAMICVPASNADAASGGARVGVTRTWRSILDGGGLLAIGAALMWNDRGLWHAITLAFVIVSWLSLTAILAIDRRIHRIIAAAAVAMGFDVAYFFRFAGIALSYGALSEFLNPWWFDLHYTPQFVAVALPLVALRRQGVRFVWPTHRLDCGQPPVATGNPE
jgi:hypothetical protein